MPTSASARAKSGSCPAASDARQPPRPLVPHHRPAPGFGPGQRPVVRGGQGRGCQRGLRRSRPGGGCANARGAPDRLQLARSRDGRRPACYDTPLLVRIRHGDAPRPCRVRALPAAPATPTPALSAARAATGARATTGTPATSATGTTPTAPPGHDDAPARLRLTFNVPVAGIASGQFAVLYGGADGTLCLGAGVMERSADLLRDRELPM